MSDSILVIYQLTFKCGKMEVDFFFYILNLSNTCSLNQEAFYSTFHLTPTTTPVLSQFPLLLPIHTPTCPTSTHHFYHTHCLLCPPPSPPPPPKPPFINTPNHYVCPTQPTKSCLASTASDGTVARHVSEEWQQHEPIRKEVTRQPGPRGGLGEDREARGTTSHSGS